MKPEPHRQITLAEIAYALSAHSLAHARTQLADSAGAQLAASGILLKTVKRDSVKLVIKAEAMGRSFEIYASFGEREGEAVIAAKLRKNLAVTIAGKLQTFGSCALTMNDCALSIAQQ